MGERNDLLVNGLRDDFILAIKEEGSLFLKRLSKMFGRKKSSLLEHINKIV